MKKNWKVLTAIAAVLVIIVVGVVVINLRPGTTTADPEPSQDNTIVAGKFGFPVSTINIGEGGTKIALDGTTPTGYNGTCDSAAQAAANFTPVVINVNVKTWAKQKETLNSIGVPGPWVDKATIAGNIMADADAQGAASFSFDDGWIDKIDVKAGGMYRLVSCEAKKSAVVQVFYGGLSARQATAPLSYFGSLAVELTWKDDWKISDALVNIDDTKFLSRLKDEGPSGPVSGTPTGKLDVVDEALIEQLFEGKTREGWVEYENATR